MKSTMILCITVLMLSTQAAFGQDNQAAGEQLADGALEHYMGGRYDKAATEYLKAYHLYPNAIMIYNVAKAMQKQGKYSQAMMWLKEAEVQKEMPLNDETRAKIPKFRKELATQWSQVLFDEGATEFARKRWGQAATKYKKAYEVRPKALFLYSQAQAKQKLGQSQRALELVTAALDQKEMALSDKEKADAQALRLKLQEDGHSSEGLGLLGWSGVGLGVIGGGLVVWSSVVVSSVSEDNEALLSKTNQSEFDAARQDVVDDQSQARILLFSGLGLMAVGGGLLVWDLVKTDEGESVSFEVVPGFGQSYAGIRGSW